MSFRKTPDKLAWFQNLSKCVKPIESKTSAVVEIKAPKTLKQLRSFLVSVLHLIKFINNLAKICHFLRPLLNKHEEFV